MHEVRVTHEVARLRDGDQGTHRVWVETEEGRRLLEFSRNPTRMEEVPLEVLEDPYLVVTELKPERIQESLEGSGDGKKEEPKGDGKKEKPAPKGATK